MSYQRNNKYKKLEMAEFIISGTPVVNGYLTLTLVDTNFSASVSGSGTDTLALPTGYYFPRATCSITRTTASQNFTFQIEVNNTLGGKRGQTGWYNNSRSDYAEHTFKLTSSGNLKIKVGAIETSAPTIVANSRLWLWRTQL